MSEQMKSTTTADNSKNPYTLWFVILSFAAPVVAAYYMFFFGDISSFSNNGEFVKPYYKIEALQLKNEGAEFNTASLNNKWLLLMVAGNSCDDICQQRLINMRQTNKAVKRPIKIHHAVIFTGAIDDAFERFMQAELPHTPRLMAKNENIANRLSMDGSVSQIYLADPYGNVIMHFPHDLDPKLVIKDLNRLF